MFSNINQHFLLRFREVQASFKSSPFDISTILFSFNSQSPREATTLTLASQKLPDGIDSSAARRLLMNKL